MKTAKKMQSNEPSAREQAFDDAISELDSLSEESYKDSTNRASSSFDQPSLATYNPMLGIDPNSV